MSEWTTGRKPTQEDADSEGMVLTSNLGVVYWGSVSSCWAWMRNPPMPPEPARPRTIKDAVREYLEALEMTSTVDLPRLSRLRNEMESFIKEKE